MYVKVHRFKGKCLGCFHSKSLLEKRQDLQVVTSSSFTILIQTAGCCRSSAVLSAYYYLFCLLYPQLHIRWLMLMLVISVSSWKSVTVSMTARGQELLLLPSGWYKELQEQAAVEQRSQFHHPPARSVVRCHRSERSTRKVGDKMLRFLLKFELQRSNQAVRAEQHCSSSQK